MEKDEILELASKWTKNVTIIHVTYLPSANRTMRMYGVFAFTDKEGRLFINRPGGTSMFEPLTIEEVHAPHSADIANSLNEMLDVVERVKNAGNRFP